MVLFNLYAEKLYVQGESKNNLIENHRHEFSLKCLRIHDYKLIQPS